MLKVFDLTEHRKDKTSDWNPKKVKKPHISLYLGEVSTYNHDFNPIVDVPDGFALEMIDVDAEAIRVASALPGGWEEFENYLLELDETNNGRGSFIEHGVKGIVFAMSDLGFLTITACRSHFVGDYGYSYGDTPMITFNCDYDRAKGLDVAYESFGKKDSMVMGVISGMGIIHAESVEVMNDFARHLLDVGAYMRSLPPIYSVDEQIVASGEKYIGVGMVEDGVSDGGALPFNDVELLVLGECSIGGDNVASIKGYSVCVSDYKGNRVYMVRSDKWPGKIMNIYVGDFAAILEDIDKA